ncbi:MerR family transcriptional regulator [Enterococcus sp. DIV0660C]|uniref:MerR family transcriptional regulator n=1 Tax=Enterococcus sp. DIV0660C TaxID=2230880 RepID=UPI001A8E9E53|nr:MerR family transcriptional regulator [Enterococcus sp. DIV0660C]MBO0430747.1 MerR family transcriptional regulator [Enterococcus sp. DIV0660C]
MYTIGEVSRMFHLPISTLRYYDKEGFFPDLQRISGIRKFSDNELEILRVIECLKKSGLEIKEMKQFFVWCKQGSKTYQIRKELFEKQEKIIEEKITDLNKILNMVKYKQWYYDEAIKTGSEDLVEQQVPEKLPEKIKRYYENSHTFSI